MAKIIITPANRKAIFKEFGELSQSVLNHALEFKSMDVFSCLICHYALNELGCRISYEDEKDEKRKRVRQSKRAMKRKRLLRSVRQQSQNKFCAERYLEQRKRQKQEAKAKRDSAEDSEPRQE